MIDDRGLVLGVVAVVVATALVSGPLVGAVDLTSADDGVQASVGSGSVDAGDVTVPETATIETGRFGAETLYLRVPDGSIELQRVVGQPLVTYRISIPEIGFGRGSVHFVTEGNEGTFDLSMGETQIDPADVQNGSYAGELSVKVRADDGSRTVANETVTVEVVR